MLQQNRAKQFFKFNKKDRIAIFVFVAAVSGSIIIPKLFSKNTAGFALTQDSVLVLAMDTLHRKQAAAKKAAAKKNYIDALTLVDSAIAKQPRENLFWDMKGELLLRQEKPQEAITALSNAIERNPQYFKPYVFRGVAYQATKQHDKAEKDLLTSQRYLPTQVASYYLGEVYLSKGDRQKAAQYFQQVAQAGGDLGAAATKKLEAMQ